MCMSVQCVHGTQGEPGNEAMSTFVTSLYVYVLFVNVTNDNNVYP